MNRLLGGLVVAIWVAVAAGSATAQVGTTPPAAPEPAPTAVSTPPSAESTTETIPTSDLTGLSQPDAVLAAGVLALGAALLAFIGVMLTRRQADKHFAATHELEQIKALRERYTTCAEQLAHENPAVRTAGAYGLGALGDDWFSRIVPQYRPLLSRFRRPDRRAVQGDAEVQVCVELLCAYLRSSTRASEDSGPRGAVTAVLAQRSPQWQPLYLSYDLTGASLNGANLSEAELHKANLSGANLNEADPNIANLSHATLHLADLGSAKLRIANLSDADLTDADLSDADLTDADLSGADLTDADLGDADLNGANLNGANLLFANLGGANLSGAKLSGANLSGTQLTDADLSDADLGGAVLVGANLSGAKLHGVDLRGAQLRDAKLRDTLHDADTQWPGGIAPQVAPGTGNT